MPDGFLSDVDEQILKQVVDLAKAEKVGDFTPDGELGTAFKSYLEQLVRYATGEDKLWAEPRSLLNRAITAWQNSATRKSGENIIALRIEDGKDWTDKRLVLDVVTDDKPFLVDSLSATLSEAGKPVSFFSNVVIDVTRNAKGERKDGGSGSSIRESIIHAEMDPPVDENDIEKLREEIGLVLDDVSIAVSDWEEMRARLAACIAQLERSRLAGVKGEEQQQAIEFLKWLWDNRFAFLGVRRFNYSQSGDDIHFEHDVAHDLGIMKDPERRILKSTFQASGELSPAVSSFLQSDEPIIIAKANSVSLIHRRVYMDYIGVKLYAVDGSVIGKNGLSAYLPPMPIHGAQGIFRCFKLN